MSAPELSAARRAEASRRLRWEVVEATPAARRAPNVPVWRLRSATNQTAIVKAAALRDADWPPRSSQPTAMHHFLNESTALEFLTRRGCAAIPRFIGADRHLGLMLMEDLGAGPDVASVLLGSDASKALAALGAWAEALADVHAVTHGHTRDYDDMRGRAGPQGERFDVSDAADRVQSTMRVSFDPSFTNPRAIAGVLNSITRELGSPQWQVLSPDDCCPDNNVVLDDGTVRLFDFQFAGVRHALVDLAYLHTVMPTCWCAGKLPQGVVRLTTERYRNRLARVVGRAQDHEAFTHALAAARAGLALQTLTWPLAHAADSTGGDRGQMVAYDFTGYSARQLAILRLDDLADVAAERPQFEPLAELAAAIRPYLLERFGEIEPVGLYPAFARFGATAS